MWLILSGVLVFSMLLAACGGGTPQVVEQTVVVKETVVAEGETVVEEVVVTATPEPEVVEPKVMVVCMAQEPNTLYTLTDASLVKTAVLEALYDFGVDQRSYDYQPVGLAQLPKFDNGGAVQNEVEVTVGDSVYDAAQDLVVTIQPTSVVTLNQLAGGSIANDFAVTPTAKTVQLEVTWTLADGLTWQDGTPVTSEDIVFAWDTWVSPETPAAKYTPERSDSFTAVDEKSVKWVGAKGYTTGTYFLDALPNPLPKHVLGSMSAAEILESEEANRNPLAFGPFKIESWTAGDNLTLVKNDTYYRASEGLPYLDKLIYRFIPDVNQLIAQLASGECDLGTQDAAFEGSLPLIRQFEAEGIMIPQVVAGTTYEHLDFNAKPVDSYTGFAASVKSTLADGTEVPIFADPEIRMAINYCIDKQAIVDQATNGAGVVMNVYSPSDHPLYAGDEALNVIPFDPAKGLEILAAKGWTDTDADGVLDDGAGQKFAFVHSTRTNALRQKVTQIVQAQLKDNCMLETTIELYGSEYFDDGPGGLVFGRQYDMGEFAWLTGVEPPCGLYQGNQLPSDEFGWGAQNNTGFENAEFDAACVAASTSLDEAVKAEQHGIAQQIFSQNIPSIILFSRGKILVTRANVLNAIMDSTANSELWNVENFDFAP
jgi:peptide/nickel transport system substrate-binding protein